MRFRPAKGKITSVSQKHQALQPSSVASALACQERNVATRTAAAKPPRGDGAPQPFFENLLKKNQKPQSPKEGIFAQAEKVGSLLACSSFFQVRYRTSKAGPVAQVLSCVELTCMLSRAGDS